MAEKAKNISNEVNKNNSQQVYENRFHILGWILFVICAVFFIASSLKNQDSLSFIGSVIFLISCIVFIIPLTFLKNRKE